VCLADRIGRPLSTSSLPPLSEVTLVLDRLAAEGEGDVRFPSRRRLARVIVSRRCRLPDQVPLYVPANPAANNVMAAITTNKRRM